MFVREFFCAPPIIPHTVGVKGGADALEGGEGGGQLVGRQAAVIVVTNTNLM